MKLNMLGTSKLGECNDRKDRLNIFVTGEQLVANNTFFQFTEKVPIHLEGAARWS